MSDDPPGMDGCPLPTEICESIIDAIEEDFRTKFENNAFRQCALTCRAWRSRAQRRLWEIPVLDAISVDTFIAKIRDSAATHLVSYIHTLRIDFVPANRYFRLNELLLTSRIQNLRAVILERWYIDHHNPRPFWRLVHPRVLRARPPLLAHITSLEMAACSFSSLRDMLDIIWACSNLSSLKLQTIWDEPTQIEDLDAQRILLWSRNFKYLREWEKLKHLRIDLSHPCLAVPDYLYPILSEIYGCLFGAHVTDLDLIVTPDDLDIRHGLTYVPPGPFPALTTLRMVVAVDRTYMLGSPPLPGGVLCLLAVQPVAPSKWRKVVLDCRAPMTSSRVRTDNPCQYCMHLFGQGHDQRSMVEVGKMVRRQLASLEELCLVIHEKHLPKCATRIQSIWPPTLRGITTIVQDG